MDHEQRRSDEHPSENATWMRKKREMFLTLLPTEEAKKVVKRALEVGDTECLQTLFHDLVEAGAAASIVALLLKDDCIDPANDKNRALRVSCERGDEALVTLLLQDPRVDPTAKDQQALFNACRDGHAGVVSLLLADPRVDPVMSRPCAMVVAAEEGHDEVIRLLMRDGRCVAASREALHGACRDGHRKAVEALLEDERVPACTMAYDCFRASIADDDQKPGLLEMLAKKRPLEWANVDKRALLRATIHWAHLDDVKFLVEQGADPDSDLLFEAVENERPDTVAYLLSLPSVDPVACAARLSKWYRVSHNENVERIKWMLLAEKRLDVDKEAIKRAVDEERVAEVKAGVKLLKRRRALAEELNEVQKKRKLDVCCNFPANFS